MDDLSTNKTPSPREFTPDCTAYTINGNSDSVLIFIHGVGMNADVWQPQVERFSSAYKVITYDFLGHGESSMPNETPTLEDYVEQLHKLILHLDLTSLTLAGHSMGALISVAFSLKYPQLVNALIPINIVYSRSKEEQSRVLKRAQEVIESGEIGSIESTLERWFEGKNTSTEQSKIAKVGLWLSQAPAFGYGQAYRLFALSDEAFVNQLSQLRMPVLYLTGDDDPNSTPRMSEQMARLTPNGKFYSIKGEAHMMAFIAPEKANVAIEAFLNGVPQNDQ